MLDFEFAYSEGMQIILIGITFIATFVFYFLSTNIIMRVYGETVSLKRKVLFVFLTGTILNNVWTYGIYYLGGKMDFSPIIYSLVTIPNPVFAILFYLLGTKILRLSAYRSLNLFLNAYVVILFIKIFQRIFGFFLFPQPGGDWNYLLDTVSQISCVFLYLIIYGFLIELIMKSEFSIRLTDNIPNYSLGKGMLLYFAKATAIYSFLILYEQYANSNTNHDLLAMLIILLFYLIIALLIDYIGSLKVETSNKAIHIGNQNILIDGFNNLRHNLNNLLQSYGSYITLGDLEKLKEFHQTLFDTTVWLNDHASLNRKLNENPELISLLMNRLKQAEEESVSLRININCPVRDLFIDNLDLCLAIKSLLNQAIETAKNSPKRRVEFSIEESADTSKLIVISFSTKDNVDIPSITRIHLDSKTTNQGLELHFARKILNKYRNCIAQIFYYDFELSIYISIKNNDARLNIGG